VEILKLRGRDASCATKRQLDYTALQQVATPAGRRLPKAQPLLRDEQRDLPKGNSRDCETTGANSGVGQVTG
jgi:hypothetical protein